MSEYATVRVDSDGTPQGTRVSADGKTLDGVVEVTWTLRADELATVTVTFDLPEAHIEAREIVLKSGRESEDGA